jgi:hypothetical protein
MRWRCAFASSQRAMTMASARSAGHMSGHTHPRLQSFDTICMTASLLLCPYQCVHCVLIVVELPQLCPGPGSRAADGCSAYAVAAHASERMLAISSASTCLNCTLIGKHAMIASFVHSALRSDWHTVSKHNRAHRSLHASSMTGPESSDSRGARGSDTCCLKHLGHINGLYCQHDNIM